MTSLIPKCKSLIFTLILVLSVINAMAQEISIPLSQSDTGAFGINKAYQFYVDFEYPALKKPITEIRLERLEPVDRNDLRISFRLPKKLVNDLDYDIRFAISSTENDYFYESRLEFLKGDTKVGRSGEKKLKTAIWQDFFDHPEVISDQVNFEIRATINYMTDDHPGFCDGTPPKFNWLAGPLVTGIGGAAFLGGRILDRAGDKDFDKYVEGVINGKREAPEVQKYYNRANSKHKIDRYTYRYGSVLFWIGIGLTVYDLISLKKRREKYEFYCGGKTSYNALRLTPLLDVAESRPDVIAAGLQISYTF